MTNESQFFLDHLGQTSPFPFLIEVERAEGAYIYDKNGKAYLDMIAGVAVNNIGHRHPKIVAALSAQLEKHLHVMVYGRVCSRRATSSGKRTIGGFARFFGWHLRRQFRYRSN